ncbi:hypothetical protein KXS12_24050 [Priestia filamentosa]|uniref:hypothetical protein n=1 Tax=Priestia filamentosa TaxID=1402861 RepID=UPI003F14A5AC
MKLDATLLSRTDRKYYEDIKKLSTEEKRLLWYLIEKMDKNHVVILPRLNLLIKRLLKIHTSLSLGIVKK